MSLADILIWMANRAKTGVLVVQRDYVRKEMAIQDGLAVRASSNDPREYLGQFMLSFGLLTDDQLQRAFKTQEETKVLLGRILVMIGIVAEEEVVRTLQHKIGETILDAMRWTRGHFTFEERSSASDRPEIAVVVPLVDIHREAAVRAPMWEAFTAIFPRGSLGLTVSEQHLPPGLKPDSFDGRIVALARNGRTIDQIAQELHATEFALYSRLYELQRVGAIEAHNPVQPPSLNMRITAAPPPLRSPPPPPPPDIFDEFEPTRPRDSIVPLSAADEIGNSNDLVFAMEEAAPDQDAVPVLLAPLDKLLQGRSSSRERYILTRIDGTRSVGAILQISPMRDTEALEILKSLAGEGAISY